MTTQKVSAASALGAPRLAFSYRRVSDPKQAREDRGGLDRQEESFLPFCQRHGLAPSPEALIDKGRSAYHGTHRKKGALGKFIRAAEAGQIPEGSVLVVDDLSRFSRETASRAEELLHRLWQTGCALGVVAELDRVITRDVYDTDDHVGMVLGFSRRTWNRDSKEKSRKIAIVWQSRQQAWEQNGQRYLGKGFRPFWLSDDGTTFTENEESVLLVRRMFKLSSEENMGATQIAHLLFSEGIKATLGDAYGPTRITRILHDRRVLGEKEWRDGTTSSSYFPRIISEAEWAACQQAIARRHDNKGRHGRGEKIANLFQSATFCPCGHVMCLQPSRNRQGQVTYGYLRCSARRKGTCTQPPGDWPYDEQALLLSFMAERWHKLFDRPTDNRQRRQLEKKAREFEAAVQSQHEQAAAAGRNMTELLKQGGLDAPTASLLGKAVKDAEAAAHATEARLSGIRAEIQQISLRPTGAQIQQQINERVREFLAADRHDIQQRRAFNNWLQGLGVKVVITDAKLGRFKWGATDAVIYRDSKGDVISDESLGDMAAFGFSEADMAKREAEIRQEVKR
jgi:hypothetical protein